MSSKVSVMQPNRLGAGARLGLMFAALVLATSLSFDAFAQASAKSSPTIRMESAKRGVPAQMVDQGDYYLRPNGEKIKFFRKKDVYALKMRKSNRRGVADASMAQIKANFGERVQTLKNHRLGNMTVVRVDNSNKTNSNFRSSLTIDANALQVGSAGVEEVMPVLANSDGAGDLLITNKITIRLADGVDESSAIERLEKRFGLTVIRKARLSGMVYSMRAKTKRSISERFAFVRKVANSSLVEWAAPQFSTKPFKTQFTPSDRLFSDQWHLQNQGYRGSLCDADCDAPNAWGSAADADAVGARAGEGMVIAIIDDGVQLNHPEFDIWTNPGESANANNQDSDNNGFIDDLNGWDFVNDLSNANTDLVNLSNGQACSIPNDGVVGEDNDPSPQPTTACGFDILEAVIQDNHGTAVAGLAAAGEGNNGTVDTGTVGTAFLAEILPIRLISDFDALDGNFCMRAAEAIEYAGRYADVVSNSWGTDLFCPEVDIAIRNVVNGTLMDGGTNVSHRPNGSPVIFSSGNTGTGWVKISVGVDAGEHAYEWRFLRSGTPTADIPGFQETGDNDAVYIDDIQFPDQTMIDTFQPGFTDFTRGCEADTCLAGCEAVTTTDSCPFWQINTNSTFIRSGSNSARIGFDGPDLQLGVGPGACAYSYLATIRDGPAGEISFYVWVDTDQAAEADRFEFLVDQTERISFGDVPRNIFNDVAYPAVLSSDMGFEGLIAVGGSDSGPLTPLGNQTDLSQENRIYYSSYGPSLDIVAPASTQHLGITTTDRTGADGFNPDQTINGSYTDMFGGTSASAPIVAGIAAAVLATNSNMSAADVELRLENTADQIGTEPYVSGRNDFVGHGRINMARALNPNANPAASCNADDFDFSRFNDLIVGGLTPAGNICPSNGPFVTFGGDTFCFPIIAANGNISTVCL